MPDPKRKPQIRGNEPSSDPIEVDEPRNVRPPSDPTPEHTPPRATARRGEAEEEETQGGRQGQEGQV